MAIGDVGPESGNPFFLILDPGDEIFATSRHRHHLQKVPPSGAFCKP
jgi:hypothetical protein